jgi:hypothetical protein
MNDDPAKIDVQSSRLAHLVGDRPPERFDSGGVTVMAVTGIYLGLGLGSHVRGGVEIGLSEVQFDDGLTSRLNASDVVGELESVFRPKSLQPICEHGLPLESVNENESRTQRTRREKVPLGATRRLLQAYHRHSGEATVGEDGRSSTKWLTSARP